MARKIASAAEKMLGFKGIDPKGVWEVTYSQDNGGQVANRDQELLLGTDEEEMVSKDGDYDDY